MSNFTYYPLGSIDSVVNLYTPQSVLSNISSARRARSQNFPDFVTKLQNGSLSNVRLDEEINSLGMKNLKRTKSIALLGRSKENFDVKYIRGGENYIAVEWMSNTEDHPFSEIRTVSKSKPKKVLLKLLSIPNDEQLVDMVVTYPTGNGLLLAGNNFGRKQGLIAVTTYTDRAGVVTSFNYTEKSVYSCCHNKATGQFAIGMCNEVQISSLSFKQISKRPKVNVHGLTFNQQATLLFCGLNVGNIIQIDVRQRVRNFEAELDRVGISEVVLLSDENYLLCGGFNGLLCKLDLRMLATTGPKAVCQFFGHAATIRKQPFSICEQNKILCASGSDNITRLWSLDGGYPIKIIEPPLANNRPCRSWIYTDKNSSAKSTVALVQGRRMFDVEFNPSMG